MRTCAIKDVRSEAINHVRQKEGLAHKTTVLGARNTTNIGLHDQLKL